MSIYIDTKDLCEKILQQLTAHRIPQAVFAEKVLHRSQGTVSCILRNPKSWESVKSGRAVYVQMQNWLDLPLESQLAAVKVNKEALENSETRGPPARKFYKRKSGKPEETSTKINKKVGSSEEKMDMGPPAKKLDFEIRKETAPNATQIVKKADRKRKRDPSPEYKPYKCTEYQEKKLFEIYDIIGIPDIVMQRAIAEELKMDEDTVILVCYHAEDKKKTLEAKRAKIDDDEDSDTESDISDSSEDSDSEDSDSEESSNDE